MNSKVIRKSVVQMCVLFLLPTVVMIGLFFYFPAIRAGYISLFDWNGFSSDMTFVGLGNFRELLGNARFWKVPMLNTFKFLIFGGVLVFGFAMLFSGVLSTNIKGRKLMRSIIFVPNIINPIAITVLWGFIYNKRWGLLNSLLSAVGLGAWQQTWTAPKLQFGAVLAMMVWTYMGLYCVIFLSALDQVSPEVVEAATVEGANEWQIFWKVKLPLIWDVVVTSLTLWGIAAIKEFTLVFAWGGGLDIPQDSIMNFASFMYINAFGKRISIYRMGYATAMGIVMLVLVIFITTLISKLSQREAIEH